MPIETELKRIADTLERMEARMNGEKIVAPTPPAVEIGPAAGDAGAGKKRTTKEKAADVSTAGAPVDGKTAPTLDDLTDALRELVQTKGAPTAKALLVKYGADRISLVKPESYQGIYDDMKAAKAA